MKTYCKAYPLDRLRAFAGWSMLAAPDVDATVSDDDYAFVCDDLSVLLDPINETNVLIAAATAQWRQFCEDTLAFAVPAELRELVEDPPASAPAAAG